MFSVSARLKDLLRHGPLYRKLRGSRIARHYNVSRDYYETFVRGAWKMRHETSLEAFHGWVRYGLSTNIHAESHLRLLDGMVKWEGSRVLDVGCGFGGHCLGALRRGAASVTGLDLDPYYLGLAQVNTETYPGVERSKISFRRGDISDETVLRELGEGAFDVILVMDVLEHVKALPASLAALRRLLAPGGVLIAGVPNGRAAGAVLADPHLGVFGLSLLEGEAAENWCRSRANQSYAFMGTFPTLEFLMANLEAWDAHVRLLDTVESPDAELEKLPAQLAELTARAAQLNRADELEAPVRDAVEEYVALVQSRIDEAGTDEEAKALLYKNYVQRYWLLVAELG